MNTRLRPLLLALVALAILAAPAMAGIIQPTGINPQTGAAWAPGDNYKLAFITSTNPGAQLPDIASYNALIDGLATAAGLGDADWVVIGSTTLVDARDNTGTNPTVEVGCPILLVDGSTIVANDNADLWDHSVQHIINQDENGATKSHWPFTGTYWDGTTSSGKPASGGALDEWPGQVGQGNGGSTTDWVWRQWTMDPHDTALPLYGMSEKLTVVPEPATVIMLLSGLIGLALCWRCK